MQEDVLRRALGGEAEDAGRVLVESYSVSVGGQRCMVAASESRQMDAVLTRQMLLQCWIYGGWTDSKQGVGLGALEVSSGVLRVDVGTEGRAIWEGGQGVQLLLVELGGCLVRRTGSRSACRR